MALHRDRATGASGAETGEHAAPDDDVIAASQFRLLTALGLREDHYLLEIGCRSLRAGRLFMSHLRPGRYFAIEPDPRLILAARDREIGADAFDQRRPRFDHNNDLRLDVFGRCFDFIVAQSVLSHAGGDLLDRALANAGRVLSPGGQMLFTILDETVPCWDRVPRGAALTGWSFPGCVGHCRDDVIARAARGGLAAEALDWFHPRQCWYRVTAPGTPAIDAAARAAIGRGAVLFDPRFPS